MKVFLHAKYGRLYSGDQLVIYRYRDGDTDLFQWPLYTKFRSQEKQLEQITEAMMDMRETGAIPANTQIVVLPDGSEITL